MHACCPVPSLEICWRRAEPSAITSAGAHTCEGGSVLRVLTHDCVCSFTTVHVYARLLARGGCAHPQAHHLCVSSMAGCLTHSCHSVGTTSGSPRAMWHQVVAVCSCGARSRLPGERVRRSLGGLGGAGGGDRARAPGGSPDAPSVAPAVEQCCSSRLALGVTLHLTHTMWNHLA